MEEIWLDIAGYEGLYQVSNMGRVRSLSRTVKRKNNSDLMVRGRILKPCKAGSSNNYRLSVTLSNKGVMVRPLIHILVLSTFVGPRPDGLIACHANDQPFDNRLENLRWDTFTANQYDAVKNGNHGQAKKTRCKYGHEFNKENTTIYYSRGKPCRRCKICSRKQDRERKRVVANLNRKSRQD